MNATQCEFTGDQTGENRPCRLRVPFAVRTRKKVRISSRLCCVFDPPALGVLNHLWVGGCGLGIGQDISLPLIGRRWGHVGRKYVRMCAFPLIGSEGKYSSPVVLSLLSLCKM